MSSDCLKIVFAGTPVFAEIQLSAILKSTHLVSAVLTQPDKPQGRGKQLTASPVKQLALQHHIPVLQPRSLKKEAIQAQLAALKPDLLVVAAYGLLLPKAVLEIPKYGSLNVHASLLPRWRGASPIQQSILAGDAETGITLMQMSEGLDEGDILCQDRFPLKGSETSATLHDQLAVTGAQLLINALDHLNDCLKQRQPQNPALVTYAPKIQKSDAQIDWSQPAIVIERQIRAFQPWPVSFSLLQGKVIRIFKASVLTTQTSSAVPGTIIDGPANTLLVATGEGLLQIHLIQLPGKTIQPIESVLNGYPTLFQPHQQFGS